MIDHKQLASSLAALKACDGDLNILTEDERKNLLMLLDNFILQNENLKRNGND